MFCSYRKFVTAVSVATQLLLPCVMLVGWAHSAFAQRVVDLEQAREALKGNKTLVIDIRETTEHATGIAKGAKLLPMSQLNSRLGEIPKNQPVLLICHTQNRSARVAKALEQNGYTNVQYVHGGMSDWSRRGWDLVKPEN